MRDHDEHARRSSEEVLAGKALAVAGGFAVAVLLVVAAGAPDVGGLRGPRVHVAIEVTAVLVGGFAATLLAGRARRSARGADVTAAAALTVLVGVNLVLAVVPGLTDDLGDEAAGWATTIGRIVGAALLLLAAVDPFRRPLRRPRRAVAGAVALAAAGVGLLAALGAPLAAVLPGGGGAEAWATQDRPVVVLTPPAVTIALGAGLLLHLAAIPAFLARARREADELLVWLAAASLLLALSRAGFVADPESAVRWVLAGDVLRLAGYAALAVGVGREVVALQRRLADLAVHDERRRLARDLHDGLAQELAYVRRLAEDLHDEGRSAVAGELVAAGDRALEESRAAIAALSRPADEPLEQALRAALEPARRLGAVVVVSGGRGAAASLRTREALGRIVREAALNAVRHGGARRVEVEVRDVARGVRLTVRDDGSGFDVEAAAAATGFGLVSMQERVEGLGGRFALRSTPGQGTELEVVLP